MHDVCSIVAATSQELSVHVGIKGASLGPRSRGGVGVAGLALAMHACAPGSRNMYIHGVQR